MLQKLTSLSRSHKGGQRVRIGRVEGECHQMMYVVDDKCGFGRMKDQV